MEQNNPTNYPPRCINTTGVTDQSSVAGSSTMMSGSSSNPRAVTDDQKELIHKLVYYQTLYEHPSNEDLARITDYQPSEGDDPSDAEFRHIIEMTRLTVQLVVEFAKNLEGFDKLLREDQITLLKACSSEVMMLRMARKYDVQTDSIVFANNQPYTKESYNFAGLGDDIESLLRFCRYMDSMKVNNGEYALLTAIVTFSERPGVLEGWKVKKIQEVYMATLKAYVNSRIDPDNDIRYANLLSVLTVLRSLGDQNKNTLKPKNEKLPPFLVEIWDLLA
ncbi:ecdysone receptor-like [Aphidius gifuensis]|uniref:ecdysone receptor-like n=1 Tax=Aphidius gifuensis TaxID=684658 RepID=UPI001CDB69EC|nr:ecdysone receptor-like [Aphidius gifuensis]